jgi:hypothetical protein
VRAEALTTTGAAGRDQVFNVLRRCAHAIVSLDKGTILGTLCDAVL